MSKEDRLFVERREQVKLIEAGKGKVFAFDIGRSFEDYVDSGGAQDAYQKSAFIYNRSTAETKRNGVVLFKEVEGVDM